MKLQAEHSLRLADEGNEPCFWKINVAAFQQPPSIMRACSVPTHNFQGPVQLSREFFFMLCRTTEMSHVLKSRVFISIRAGTRFTHTTTGRKTPSVSPSAPGRRKKGSIRKDPSPCLISVSQISCQDLYWITEAFIKALTLSCQIKIMNVQSDRFIDLYMIRSRQGKKVLRRGSKVQELEVYKATINIGFEYQEEQQWKNIGLYLSDLHLSKGLAQGHMRGSLVVQVVRHLNHWATSCKCISVYKLQLCIHVLRCSVKIYNNRKM